MTIKEVKEMFRNEYCDVEVYVDKWNYRAGFHTDRIESVDDYSDKSEVLEYELMDKEMYSATVLANVGLTWEDYGLDDDDKILVIKVVKNTL